MPGMSEDLFVDGLGAVATAGPIVKVALLSLAPVEGDAEAWQAEVRHRLVLFPRALAELARGLKDLVGQAESMGWSADQAPALPAWTQKPTVGLVPETVIEGVGRVSLQAGFVRVELTALEPDQVSLRDELRPVPRLRLHLTPAGAFTALGRLEAELERHGVRLMPRGQGPRPVSHSPNFGGSPRSGNGR